MSRTRAAGCLLCAPLGVPIGPLVFRAAPCVRVYAWRIVPVAPLSTQALSAAFQKRRRAPARLWSLALVLTSLVLAALLARFGLAWTRVLGATVLVSALLQVFFRRARDARDFRDVRRTIRRVLLPVDRLLAERALRAAALAEQAERDPDVGSLELARLHFERLLARASLSAVDEHAARRARRQRGAALCLLLVAVLVSGSNPLHVLEGWDVLFARRGVAPLSMSWLDFARITVQPPAYLHSADRAIFPGDAGAEAVGSTIVVRGMPLAEASHLVLSDGHQEIPFVDDGAGGVVARYTLNETVELRVAARFGSVLIFDPERLAVEAVFDRTPEVALEGAPERVELRDFERKELRYEVSDDHGLREIDLVLRAGGREDRRPLARLDGETKFERSAYAIEGSDPFLQRSFLPVDISVEARDDATLSGVKWGKSAVITLVPVPLGESEMARYRALLAARDELTDLLASELEPRDGPSELEQRNADERRTVAAAQSLRRVLERRFGNLRLAPGLKAFLGGQARVLERALPTPASAMRRTEDVLLATDAALRSLGNHDAEALAKRLADVAEEVADGAKQALESERRTVGLSRLDRALTVLATGAAHLSVLGPLGRDVGSVAESETRRVARAKESANLLATELAARHLAARLRRPSPSFSTAGGGGVESGSATQTGDAAPPSDADKKFDELVGELERLAEEHQQELDRVDRALADSEKSVDLDDLKQEAQDRARSLREKIAFLPQFAEDPNSARASAALGREHAEVMAQNLARLALKDAVDNGRHARSELSDAKQKLKAQLSFDLPEGPLGEAESELGRDLAWAEQSAARAQKSSEEKAAPLLQASSVRERALAERAANLSGRGNHGEIALPEELADALGKAEGLMRDAAKELSLGHGEPGLTLQRDAQRLLEQSNTGQASSESDKQDSTSPPPKGASGSQGKQMRTDADVPRAGGTDRAAELRRRILEGLAKEKSGRLSDAVRRYAEGLLR